MAQHSGNPGWNRRTARLDAPKLRALVYELSREHAQLRPYLLRVMTATLAADHRANDGHRGGLFPAAIDRLL